MSFRLATSHQLIIPDKKIRKHLFYHETATGISTTLDIEFKNIGDAQFPGAAFEYSKIEWGSSLLGSPASTQYSLASCPKLEPTQSTSFRIAVYPPFAGPVWFKSKLNGVSEYYADGRQSSLKEDQYLFNIVSRQEVELLISLERISKELSEIKEGLSS